MSISSDEINYLIYRYLQENGFSHTAFTFAYESLIIKSSVSQTDVPPGALITFLQKGLEYVGIEEHINEDGTVREFDQNYSLLSPFICDAVATKEDRRPRRIDGNDGHSMNIDDQEDNEGQPGEVAPSTISLKMDNGSRLLHLLGHQGEVFMCMWNPVSRQLASGSADGMCRLWGLWEMDEKKWDSSEECEFNMRSAIMPHSNFVGERFKDVTSVTWSSDGQYLATGCYDGMARIWDNQGTLKNLLKEHTGPVFSLKWSKHQNYILSGSYDKRAIVWCAEKGIALKVFLLHSAPVLDVDWKDSDTFATCSSDMSIQICKVSNPEASAFKTFKGHLDEVNAVCWSPGGALLASCSDDNSAKIWSVDHGLLHDLKGHLKEIYTVRWTPTGPGSANPDKNLHLCTASFDGTVKIWSADTGNLVFNLRRQAQPVYSIAPSPSGDYLATGSLGGSVTVWSLKDGSVIREMRGQGDTFDVSWSHDGSMLCACFSSGTLLVIDMST